MPGGRYPWAVRAGGPLLGAMGIEQPELPLPNQLDTDVLTDSPPWFESQLTSLTSIGANQFNLEEYDMVPNTVGAGHTLIDFTAPGVGGTGLFVVKVSGTAQFGTIKRGSNNSNDYICYDFIGGSVTENGGAPIGSRITLIANGYYLASVNSNATGNQFGFGASDTGTPGVANPSFETGAGYVYSLSNAWYGGFLTDGELDTYAAELAAL